MGTCFYCHEKEEDVDRIGDREVCKECLHLVGKYQCDINEEHFEPYESYKDHLRTKHTHKELAEFMSNEAKRKRDYIFIQGVSGSI